MKNKKVVYILLPLTLVIWGVIIYKIISSLGPDESTLNSEQFNLPVGTISQLPDTFSIVADYRDPFLGKQVSLNNSPAKTPLTKKAVKAPPPLSKSWPDVKYNGTIKNQSSKKERVLIQINGTEYIMKPNDEIENIKVLKIFRDSVIVAFGKEKKTVVK